MPKYRYRLSDGYCVYTGGDKDSAIRQCAVALTGYDKPISGVVREVDVNDPSNYDAGRIVATMFVEPN